MLEVKNRARAVQTHSQRGVQHNGHLQVGREQGHGQGYQGKAVQGMRGFYSLTNIFFPDNMRVSRNAGKVSVSVIDK